MAEETFSKEVVSSLTAAEAGMDMVTTAVVVGTVVGVAATVAAVMVVEVIDK
jgi:hypothetical protein